MTDNHSQSRGEPAFGIQVALLLVIVAIGVLSLAAMP